MNQPTLSVVICNYNHARFLPESLQAMLDQTYYPLEILVIDDGSTDNSVEVIESFAKRHPMIRLIRNDQNRGVLFCANRGLELVSGEYVYFASADDKVLPGLFEKSMNLLAQHPQAGICSALSLVIDEKGEGKGLAPNPIISRTRCYLSPEKVRALLQRHGSWFCVNTTVICQRDALIEVGGFIPELRSYCDAFIDQVLALKYGACFIPEPLALWRRTTSTLSTAVIANPDMMLDIMRHAQRLMQSTYRDLFPPDYVDNWEREWQFNMGVSLITTSQGTQIVGLRRVLSLPTLSDRAFFMVLRLFMEVERLVTKLYLFARLRRSHLWPVLARKLKNLSMGWPQ